jgi:hypothetical protein
MVSCEQNPSVDEQPSEQVKVRLTASVETTRTVLGEDLSVLWQEGDCVTMWAVTDGDMQESKFTLVEGANTKEAVFEGYMPKVDAEQVQYYVTYGENIVPGSVYLSEWQNYRPGSFGTTDSWLGMGSPLNQMFAEYTPGTDKVNFRNMFGMMKLEVYGSGLLYYVEITAEGEILAGEFYFDTETLELECDNGASYTYINNINTELTEEPLPLYVVLPPGTYENITLTFYDDSWTEYSVTATNPIEISRSVITPVTPAIEVVVPEAPGRDQWQIVGTMNDWAPGYGILMENVDEWGSMVAAYNVELTTEDEFKFLYGNDWGNPDYGYYGASVEAGYYYSAVASGPNITVAADGIYDLYLDLANERIYVMSAGDDWTNAQDSNGGEAPVDTYGVMGDLLGNNWEYDVVMSDAGDGWYVAYGVRFDNVNGQGAAFKIRINGSWDEQYGSANGSYYVTDQAISTVKNDGSSANILVEAVVGLAYDIWFNVNTEEVWVMRSGCMPGDYVEPMCEFYTPYMYGATYQGSYSVGDKEYDSQVSFMLSQAYVYEGWTMQEYSNALFFDVYYNASEIAYPARIISGDTTGSCFMTRSIYIQYVENGNVISGAMVDDAVLNVTENGIEAYALYAGAMWHYVYEGPLKLGFANKTYDGTQTEQFVILEELDPMWR